MGREMAVTHRRGIDQAQQALSLAGGRTIIRTAVLRTDVDRGLARQALVASGPAPTAKELGL